jgi:hypothetical protein
VFEGVEGDNEKIMRDFVKIHSTLSERFHVVHGVVSVDGFLKREQEIPYELLEPSVIATGMMCAHIPKMC